MNKTQELLLDPFKLGNSPNYSSFIFFIKSSVTE
jgi:hypothetical protein